MTLPLSRFYAENQAKLPSPFKALQIGPVFRADRPQKGRFREFWQCDIDIFGDSSFLSEIDLLLAMGTLLQEIGFGEQYPFYIVVNDREILKAMQRYAGFPEGDFEQISIILDKEDKIGRDGVRGNWQVLAILRSRFPVIPSFWIRFPERRKTSFLLGKS